MKIIRYDGPVYFANVASFQKSVYRLSGVDPVKVQRDSQKRESKWKLFSLHKSRSSTPADSLHNLPTEAVGEKDRVGDMVIRSSTPESSDAEVDGESGEASEKPLRYIILDASGWMFTDTVGLRGIKEMICGTLCGFLNKTADLGWSFLCEHYQDHFVLTEPERGKEVDGQSKGEESGLAEEGLIDVGEESKASAVIETQWQDFEEPLKVAPGDSVIDDVTATRKEEYEGDKEEHQEATKEGVDEAEPEVECEGTREEVKEGATAEPEVEATPGVDGEPS
ncbi:hypothetical protein EGR_11169 [Echinococcus granulosus]|uniref:STAS domain-containing protein n=1 Tax=Echinococcus granulosus TaxID=6210 RepID=W6UKG2_ECHGR|nr:hypothetical protein EGR_11169 [Echinococcus granulosus]EUB53974.1 hypothetical protein EGR_11169 [Echinococcus granulosus]